MNELYFENVCEVGKLYLEHIFLEFELEPILFVCSDDENELYLCLCSDFRKEQKWIISKTDLSILNKLVAKQIDIRSALCIPENVIEIVMDISGNENSCKTATMDIDELDWPEEDVFLRCNETKARDYLKSKKDDDITFDKRIFIKKAELNQYINVFENEDFSFQSNVQRNCFISSNMINRGYVVSKTSFYKAQVYEKLKQATGDTLSAA